MNNWRHPPRQGYGATADARASAFAEATARQAGGGVNPGKALGIKVRQALSSHVKPFNFKKIKLTQPGKMMDSLLFPTISNQFQSLFKSKMKTPSTDLRYAIYDSRKLSGARIKGMAMPQSARCAGKQRRSATLSTIPARQMMPAATTNIISNQFQSIPINSNQFQSIPINSNQFQSLFKYSVRPGPDKGPAAADFSMYNAQSAI